jgi:hypothetical protein
MQFSGYKTLDGKLFSPDALMFFEKYWLKTFGTRGIRRPGAVI